MSKLIFNQFDGSLVARSVADDCICMCCREFKNSDIDLNADYSDDEETIEIGEKDLTDYL